MRRFLTWAYLLAAWRARRPREEEQRYQRFLLATYGKLD